jgi:tRNA (guanine-N7-)-methyltransferase
MANDNPLHRIKSFVLRQGKITIGQKKAVDELMPHYGINYNNSLLELDKTFGNDNPVIIEIGFGRGDATWQIAKNNPQLNYLAIEVHTPGVGSLLMAIRQHSLNNIRIIQHDAVEVLTNMINHNSISGFHIYFPDPWHKKRHNKRRIIQQPFVNLLTDKLIANGYIHLATDWEDYANWMLNQLSISTHLINSATNNAFIPRPEFRPPTKFEQRGINLGHQVWDIMFRKKPE